MKGVNEENMFYEKKKRDNVIAQTRVKFCFSNPVSHQ